jgi:hypothetical protein
MAPEQKDSPDAAKPLGGDHVMRGASCRQNH